MGPSTRAGRVGSAAARRAHRRQRRATRRTAPGDGATGCRGDPGEGDGRARDDRRRPPVTTSDETYLPRLNHVAFTMDRSQLDDAGRAEILDFYGEVFGWTEGDNSMEQGNPLILYTGEFAQFV